MGLLSSFRFGCLLVACLLFLQLDYFSIEIIIKKKNKDTFLGLGEALVLVGLSFLFNCCCLYLLVYNDTTTLIEVNTINQSIIFLFL